MRKIMFTGMLGVGLFLMACSSDASMIKESKQQISQVEEDTAKQEEFEQPEQKQIEPKFTESNEVEIGKIEPEQVESKRIEVGQIEAEQIKPQQIESMGRSGKEENLQAIEDAYTECLYGITFLGYESTEGEITPPYAYIDQEAFQKMEAVMYEGDEYYLIVPKNEDVKVEIFTYDAMDPIGGIGDYLYQSETGVPIIIRCNVSDLYPNTVIRFEQGDKSVSYSPYINLMDGSVEIEEGGYRMQPLEAIPPIDNDSVYLQHLMSVIGEAYFENNSFIFT